MADIAEPGLPVPGRGTLGELLAAVDRALLARGDADGWAALRRRGMGEDFGWEEPAAAYEALYAELRPRSDRSADRAASDTRPRR